MNLLEIRKWFVADSGRLDLMNPDGSDNGADKYINAGQRFLDQLGVVSKRQAKAYYKIRAGQMDAILPAARVVENVFVIYNGARFELSKLSELELHWRHPRLNEIGRGQPQNYLLFTNRGIDNVRADELPINSDQPRISSGRDGKSTGLTLVPPPDVDCVIEIMGVYFSTPLEHDSDQSFWSDRFPSTLVKAALYQLEQFFRNTEGANDWLLAVQADVRLIEMDLVEEESNGINQIWG